MWRCLFSHEYGDWGKVQEIPVWKYIGIDTKPNALGNQPQTRNLYQGVGGVVSKVEADLNYVLAGKVVEQRRSCVLCGFTQVNKQNWTV